MIVDAHFDLGPVLYGYHLKGERNIIENRLLSNWKQNDVRLIVAAIFLEDQEVESGALENALNQLMLIREEIKITEGIELVEDLDTLNETLEKNSIGIIMSLEGLEPIKENPLMLDMFYELGVRAAGLTWSRQNAIGDGSRFGGGSSTLGISDFGKQIISQMRDLKMIVDVSHLNDAGVEDIDGTIIASHSNARAVNEIERNLTDQHLEKIAKTGGIIGINNIKPIVGGNQDVHAMCDHIDYIKGIVGADKICFGFDLCKELEMVDDPLKDSNEGGIDVLEDYSDVKLLKEELVRRGYSKDEVKGISSLNFIDFLKEYWQ